MFHPTINWPNALHVKLMAQQFYLQIVKETASPLHPDLLTKVKQSVTKVYYFYDYHGVSVNSTFEEILIELGSTDMAEFVHWLEVFNLIYAKTVQMIPKDTKLESVPVKYRGACIPCDGLSLAMLVASTNTCIEAKKRTLSAYFQLSSAEVAEVKQQDNVPESVILSYLAEKYCKGNTEASHFRLPYFKNRQHYLLALKCCLSYVIEQMKGKMI